MHKEDQEKEDTTQTNTNPENSENTANAENTENQDNSTVNSTNTEETTEVNSTSEVEVENAPESNSSDDFMTQLTAAKDKYLRIYAEFENYRRRTNKEKQEIIKTGTEGLIKNLLPVIDDFERALKSMGETQNNEQVSPEVKAVEEGIQLIFNKFFKILQDTGLKPTESAIGKPFDLEEHESIAQIPAPSDELKGKVIDEIEKGYYLHDKVIRFSKVVIGS